MNTLSYGSGNSIMKCMLHEHACWEIILHRAGHVTSLIGNHSYYITEGDVMIIPPKVKHDGNSDVKYSDIYVQARTLDFPNVLVVHDFDGNILTLMNMLYKVLSEKEINYTNIADSLLDTICHYIKKLSNVSFQNPVVYKLKNTIYENIGNADFDLTHEITQSGSNADYLRRCFKKEIGKTPLGYLTWLRINQAKTLLLQDTFISVEDVSARCGFHDPFYFSTCFKKHVGTAPLQYRNRLKNAIL